MMESCWAGQPSQRPLLGLVEPIIQSIKLRYEQGRSVMPDRFSRKKRSNRIMSWPNPSDELKLENLPNPDKPENGKNEKQKAKDEKPTSTQNRKKSDHIDPISVMDRSNNGLPPGMTDIDRTVCVNRDHLKANNVFGDGPNENIGGGDNEIFDCVGGPGTPQIKITNEDDLIVASRSDINAQKPVPYVSSNR